MKTLTQYHDLIKEAIGQPSELADLLVEASADFGRYSEMYAEYEIEKAKFIDETKFALEKPLSDDACENKWIITEKGNKWIYLKNYLRGLKQINKAIESALYTANAEAKNQY